MKNYCAFHLLCRVLAHLSPTTNGMSQGSLRGFAHLKLLITFFMRGRQSESMIKSGVMA